MPRFILNVDDLSVSKPYLSDETEDLTDDIDALDDVQIDNSYVFDTDALTFVTAQKLIG